ncbi:DUF87 domain-containing protein [Candidatus Gracilibacteria bacterium]|nr:DUF87 domain-containing protein [Candidatus Gracilibacteria bacterium]
MTKSEKKQVSPVKKTIKSDNVFFQIKPFKDNEFGVNHWDAIIKNLISLKSHKISFIISGSSVNIKFFVIVPKSFKNYFKNIFYSNYPTSDLEEIKPFFVPQKRNFIRFSDEGILKTQAEFTKDGTYMDPLKDILALYNNIDKDSKLNIYFDYKFKFKKNIFQIILGFFKWARGAKRKKEVTDEDEIKKEILISLSYAVRAKDIPSKEGIQRNIVSVLSPMVSDGKIKIKKSEKFQRTGFNQVINFFHIPTKINFSKGLEYCLYRKLPYPTNIPTPDNRDEKDLTILGDTDYRGEKIRFGIKKDDKFRHMYIVGKTGTGKSTFIANMLKSDMMTGNGLALLDPHGELVDIILEHIPTNRINDVILFDVADSDFPLGFNLFQSDTEEGKNLVASGVVSTFKRLFGNSRGPRLEYILRNVVLSLVEYPNATLMHILRVLTDKNFREDVISNVKDGVVLKFRQTEFNKRNDKQREEAVGPITNKVGQFLSSKLVRNIFGQPRTKLSLRKAMDEGKIILVNLSKGRIGEDNANMIGSLLVTKFQIDAMSRADIPAHLRRDFYLYIDEFQNFATESFVTILSEARKYKLSLIVANQYTSQLLPEIKDAIFGNVGSIISFTLGKDDADVITGQFKEMASVNDLISLPKFTAYTRLMIDGISSDPFNMKTLPISTPDGSLELIDKIRKQSRQRYATPKDQLERLMNAWNAKTFSIQEKIAEKAKLEGLGLSELELKNLENQFVVDHDYLFREFNIDGDEPDAIIFDTDNNSHKALRYTKPKGLEDQTNIKYKKGGKIGTIPTHIDIYEHQTIKIQNNGPLVIRVGKKEDCINQLEDIIKNAGLDPAKNDFLKFCPNTNKLESSMPKKEVKPITTKTMKQSNIKDSNETVKQGNNETFSIKDIKLGQEYEGYIKLSYNYGMFVTVKGVEGLLHKNWIVAPDGVERKKFYNIGDKIKVKAKEFKEVNGEERVVRSQK